MRQFHKVSSNDPSAASLGDLLGDAASQGAEIWVLAAPARSQTSAPCEASAKLLRSLCEASAKKVGHHHNWTMLITIWLYDYVHSFSPGVDHSGHPLPSTGIKNQQEPRQKNFQAVMNIVCSAKHCVLCPHAILCSECACCRSLCLPSSTKISVFDWVWFCYIKSMSTMHRHTILMLSLDLERS